MRVQGHIVAMETTNIVICGVGGQGILLASEVLALAALKAGLDVKKSEVHGMAQRGGSVVSHVRFGSKVYSPLVEEGSAHVLLAFEKAEALRWVHYLHPGKGICIVNDVEIVPVMVTAGLDSYPENVVERLRRAVDSVYLVRGRDLASQAGNPRTENVALLGALSQVLSLPAEAWRDALAARVPEKFLSANLRAFELGRKVSLG